MPEAANVPIRSLSGAPLADHLSFAVFLKNQATVLISPILRHI
jgi:hypothetical protein